MIDLDELGKLREYLEDETVKHLIETERDRSAFNDPGCRCVLCVSRHGLLAMMQQVRRSVKAHSTVAKLYGKAIAERDAALARIAELEQSYRIVERLYKIERQERIEAEARIAEAAKLHRKYTYYDLEDSCPDTTDEHREEHHHESDEIGEFYCDQMPTGDVVCDNCRDVNGDRMEWPCPTRIALGLNEGEKDVS